VADGGKFDAPRRGGFTAPGRPGPFAGAAGSTMGSTDRAD